MFCSKLTQKCSHILVSACYAPKFAGNAPSTSGYAPFSKFTCSSARVFFLCQYALYSASRMGKSLNHTVLGTEYCCVQNNQTRFVLRKSRRIGLSLYEKKPFLLLGMLCCLCAGRADRVQDQIYRRRWELPLQEPRRSIGRAVAGSRYSPNQRGAKAEQIFYFPPYLARMNVFESISVAD